MTAFYMFRLIYLTFYGKPRMSHEAEHHIHESPASMTMPLVVLAVMSLMAGFLGFPQSLLDWSASTGRRTASRLFSIRCSPKRPRCSRLKNAGQLAAGIKEEEKTNGTEYLLMFLSVAAAGFGYYMAGRAYSNADKGYTEPIAAAAPPVYNVLLNKYYVDEGYDYVFTGRRKLGEVRLGVLGTGRSVHMV